jgi:CPA2 family monovalent cation:H+ antiporter-2
MGHDVGLLAALTGPLAAALVLGFATQRAGLSPIVGYLLAGIVVGPFTPGFVAHGDLARQLANVGVILLMFGVGLNFHVEELLAVRRVALPGSLLCIAVATTLGCVIARTFGWGLRTCIAYGLTISVSSTVVLLRVLSDRDALHTRAGHIAVGWLVVEDLFAVLALVLVPVAGVAGRASGQTIALHGLAALAKIAGLVVLTFTVARPVLRTLFGYVARTRSRDLFTLTVLVVALGVAVGSASLFGASMPLGAFLAGMVVGQSEFGSRAASEALPMRDAFAVVFFVSIGMLFDPRAFVPNLGLVTATLGVILLGKPLAAFGIARLLRTPPTTAATVAVALGQIGEFSFIMAGVGRDAGLLPDRAMHTVVAASIVSITLDPLLMRLLDRALRPRRIHRVAEPEHHANDVAASQRHRAVVVGYGPVGRTLTRLLREYSIEPTVIEMNHETVNELKRAGIAAVYGDATRREILERAGVAKAGSLVFAASGSPADAVIRMARDLNPSLRILTRTTYVREVFRAKEAGANVVIAAEAEVAMAMTEHLLTQLGASGEQLDRARERVRRDVG